ncbi:MAG: response regulator [Desulfobacterales bacterium]|nr:response regulator [Desulfobacterales bacterium]
MENYKVLIIEDDLTALKFLGNVLSKEGFEIFLAPDGYAGMEIFNNELPDIVITDIKMPGKTGFEILQEIKMSNPNTQVIVTTAFGETDLAVKAIHGGALDYIKKPIDLEVLMLALERANSKIITYKRNNPFPVILLVEDDDSARNNLVRALGMENFKVISAANGAEGVEKFSKCKIDVVLLDIKMPKMNGIDALKKMREISNDFEAIILTGYGDESDAIKAMRSGALSFLKKPIDLDQTFVSIEKALEVLKTTRALKFRSRELELANDIIATITKDKEIYLDFRDMCLSNSVDFADNLLNLIPLSLMVVSLDSRIVIYCNNRIKKLITYPQKLSDDIILALEKVGVFITLENLNALIARFENSNANNVEYVSTGEFSNITFTSIIQIVNGKKQKLILMLIRQERQLPRPQG